MAFNQKNFLRKLFDFRVFRPHFLISDSNLFLRPHPIIFVYILFNLKNYPIDILVLDRGHRSPISPSNRKYPTLSGCT